MKRSLQCKWNCCPSQGALPRARFILNDNDLAACKLFLDDGICTWFPGMHYVPIEPSFFGLTFCLFVSVFPRFHSGEIPFLLAYHIVRRLLHSTIFMPWMVYDILHIILSPN